MYFSFYLYTYIVKYNILYFKIGGASEMMKKTLEFEDFQNYANEVRKGLEKKENLPKYPIKLDHVVQGATTSGITIAPEMIQFEEVPSASKPVNFKTGEGDNEFVLKYRTTAVRYEDPENPGKYLTMEIPVMDMADVNAFVDTLINVSELYQRLREFGLVVLATHSAFNGPVSIKHTGPQLAEKLTTVNGNAAFTVTQLKNSGKTLAEISDALKALNQQKQQALIRNAVYVNSTKSFITALKEVKEQLSKAPAVPVINVADSPATAVIHTVPTVEAEPINVGTPKKPEKETDILG